MTRSADVVENDGRTPREVSALTPQHKTLIRKIAMAFGLGAAMTFVIGVPRAQRGWISEEFVSAKDDSTQQSLELKGDLLTAMRRASDAVVHAGRPELTNRLEQLTAEATRLLRELNSSHRKVAARPKVTSLVSRLETLEGDALKSSEIEEGHAVLIRSQLEVRLLAAVAAARNASQNRDANAQKEFEALAARAFALKDSIRGTTSPADFEKLKKVVAELEDESQRISTTTRVEPRPQSDVARWLAAIGFLSSTASAVILTLLSIRIRQRLEQLSLIHRKAVGVLEALEQSGRRTNVQVSSTR